MQVIYIGRTVILNPAYIWSNFTICATLVAHKRMKALNYQLAYTATHRAVVYLKW